MEIKIQRNLQWFITIKAATIQLLCHWCSICNAVVIGSKLHFLLLLIFQSFTFILFVVCTYLMFLLVLLSILAVMYIMFTYCLLWYFLHRTVLYKAEHLYSALHGKDHFKALRHESHSFTCNKHHACLTS